MKRLAYALVVIWVCYLCLINGWALPLHNQHDGASKLAIAESIHSDSTTQPQLQHHNDDNEDTSDPLNPNRIFSASPPFTKDPHTEFTNHLQSFYASLKLLAKRGTPEPNNQTTAPPKSDSKGWSLGEKIGLGIWFSIMGIAVLAGVSACLISGCRWPCFQRGGRWRR